MTRKFVKRSEFSTISSDHACGHTLAILAVGRASCRSLFAGSSYIEPRPAAGLPRWSLEGEKISKWPVVQYHHKQRLFHEWQEFIYPGVGLCDRVCHCNTYIKIRAIQSRLFWPLRKDDTQIREEFEISEKPQVTMPANTAAPYC